MMSETEKYELTQEEKKEVERLSKKAEATHEFIFKAGLEGAWSGDSERFMALAYGLTEALLEHSRTLGRLTWGLLTVSVVLAGLTIVLICRTF